MKRLLPIGTAILFFNSACGSKVTEPTPGGETHWLAVCDGDAVCGSGLACLCGVCTRSCRSDSQCDDLDSEARCVSPEESNVSSLCAHSGSPAPAALCARPRTEPDGGATPNVSDGAVIAPPDAAGCATRALEDCQVSAGCQPRYGTPVDLDRACADEQSSEYFGCYAIEDSCMPRVTTAVSSSGGCYLFPACVGEGFSPPTAGSPCEGAVDAPDCADIGMLPPGSQHLRVELRPSLTEPTFPNDVVPRRWWLELDLELDETSVTGFVSSSGAADPTPGSSSAPQTGSTRSVRGTLREGLLELEPLSVDFGAGFAVAFERLTLSGWDDGVVRGRAAGEANYLGGDIIYSSPFDAVLRGGVDLEPPVVTASVGELAPLDPVTITFSEPLAADAVVVEVPGEDFVLEEFTDGRSGWLQAVSISPIGLWSKSFELRVTATDESGNAALLAQPVTLLETPEPCMNLDFEAANAGWSSGVTTAAAYQSATLDLSAPSGDAMGVVMNSQRLLGYLAAPVGASELCFWFATQAPVGVTLASSAERVEYAAVAEAEPNREDAGTTAGFTEQCFGLPEEADAGFWLGIENQEQIVSPPYDVPVLIDAIGFR